MKKYKILALRRTRDMLYCFHLIPWRDPENLILLPNIFLRLVTKFSAYEIECTVFPKLHCWYVLCLHYSQTQLPLLVYN